MPSRGRRAVSPTLIALDRSLRSIDADGHMRVEESRISKANVCPYYGREIPDYERLGLDPSRIYRLFRDPKELEKGASTFDGKPLLIRHVPIDADLPRKELWVGTVGNCEFVSPYLVTRPLMVLTKEAIDLIASRAQRELSAAYRYDAEMVPGVWGAEPYDGRMVNIRGNHVAIVSEGRAGPDVHVADALPPELRRMSRKITLATSLAAVLATIIPEEHKAAAALALDGALGETPAESVISLDAEEMKACDEAALAEKREAKGADAELDDEDKEAAYKKARDKKAKDKKAKDKKAKDAAAAKDKARDKDPDAAEDADPAAEDADPDHRKDFDPIKAKDELSRELKAQFRAAAEARELVRPLVGHVSMALDEAPAIYRHALKAAGVDAKDVHDSALKPMVEMALSVRTRPSDKTKVAMDAATSDATDIASIFTPKAA